MWSVSLSSDVMVSTLSIGTRDITSAEPLTILPLSPISADMVTLSSVVNFCGGKAASVCPLVMCVVHKGSSLTLIVT